MLLHLHSSLISAKINNVLVLDYHFTRELIESINKKKVLKTNCSFIPLDFNLFENIKAIYCGRLYMKAYFKSFINNYRLFFRNIAKV